MPPFSAAISPSAVHVQRRWSNTFAAAARRRASNLVLASTSAESTASRRERCSSMAVAIRSCSGSGASGITSLRKRSCVTFRPLSLTPVFISSMSVQARWLCKYASTYSGSTESASNLRRYILPEIMSFGRVFLTKQATPHLERGPAQVNIKSPLLTSRCGRGSSVFGRRLLCCGKNSPGCMAVVFNTPHSSSEMLGPFSHLGLHP